MQKSIPTPHDKNGKKFTWHASHATTPTSLTIPSTTTTAHHPLHAPPPSTSLIFNYLWASTPTSSSSPISSQLPLLIIKSSLSLFLSPNAELWCTRTRISTCISLCTPCILIKSPGKYSVVLHGYLLKLGHGSHAYLMSAMQSWMGMLNMVLFGMHVRCSMKCVREWEDGCWFEYQWFLGGVEFHYWNSWCLVHRYVQEKNCTPNLGRAKQEQWTINFGTEWILFS